MTSLLTFYNLAEKHRQEDSIPYISDNPIEELDSAYYDAIQYLKDKDLVSSDDGTINPPYFEGEYAVICLDYLGPIYISPNGDYSTVRPMKPAPKTYSVSAYENLEGTQGELILGNIFEISIEGELFPEKALDAVLNFNGPNKSLKYEGYDIPESNSLSLFFTTCVVQLDLKE